MPRAACDHSAARQHASTGRGRRTCCSQSPGRGYPRRCPGASRTRVRCRAARRDRARVQRSRSRRVAGGGRRVASACERPPRRRRAVCFELIASAVPVARGYVVRSLESARPGECTERLQATAVIARPFVFDPRAAAAQREVIRDGAGVDASRWLVGRGLYICPLPLADSGVTGHFGLFLSL
jgi:hypothetical protein